MKIITVRDEPAAIVTATRTTYTDAYAALPKGHPDLRLATWKAVYAHDIITGELDGPYTEQHAERFAREALIPAGTFLGLADRPDHVLADHYCVPVEQIKLRRSDLAAHRS